MQCIVDITNYLPDLRATDRRSIRTETGIIELNSDFCSPIELASVRLSADVESVLVSATSCVDSVLPWHL